MLVNIFTLHLLTFPDNNRQYNNGNTINDMQ